MMKSVLNIILVLGFALSTTGCASINKKLKAMFGKSAEPEQQAAAQPKSTNPRFSEVDNYKLGAERQYKRMNREQFEEEAQVGDTAGSLWVMEGQGAYLFTQNTKRLAGDFVNINIEGPPQQQLQTKTNVIAKLLKKLERAAEAPAVRAPASAQDKTAAAQNSQNKTTKDKDQKTAAQKPDDNQQNAQNDQQPQPGDQPPQQKQPGGFDVAQVPARIVETLKDGSYRVKGSQQFMIGKREYKVIVTGVVRPEDFNEEGTSATKILDGQFDIVSNKKGATTL